MRGTIIERQIRRCNRNLLLVNVGVICFMLLLIILQQRYLYNCFAGPFPVAPADLPSMDATSVRQEFIAVSEEVHPIDTGIYLSHTTNGTETSKDHFLVARVGGRLLLIKSPSATPSEHLEGAIALIPTNVRDLIEVDLQKRGDGHFDTLLFPFMLDNLRYRSDLYLALGLGLPIFGLCIYNVKKALARMENSQQSPIYFAVSRYGDDVHQIASMLEVETSSSNVKQYGAFTLTPSWLLHETFFSFTPFHLSDIVWVYQKQTQHYYNFIPTGKSHGIVVADAIGRKAETDLGRGVSEMKRLEELMGFVISRTPWVVTGYSNDLKNLYEKDLPAFVAAVVERRREVESLSEATCQL